ncbi:hypothetical protein [Janthinobacterium sp. SUN137]|uniref:hypothetical protein n=1 Tax=Janthinobacterium sp. SUN137 TaxID=3014789 RepID=UPI00271393C6|nr:hypothetical protein [Janthinobacterium sp. SUN137]MDO8039579.1 hypothetical protein [Janthinobacterium sp. SUN137]
MANMNEYFVAAVATIGLVAMIHSVWGEKRIFNRLRCGKLAPSNAGGVLLEWHVRIHGSRRHVLTVFGLCITAVLLQLAFPSVSSRLAGFIVQACAVVMLAGAALVFLGSRARYSG